MEALNLLLLSMSQFLQNSSRMSPKTSKITQKIKTPFPSMSAATLLGPNLVPLQRPPSPHNACRNNYSAAMVSLNAWKWKCCMLPGKKSGNLTVQNMFVYCKWSNLNAPCRSHTPLAALSDIHFCGVFRPHGPTPIVCLHTQCCYTQYVL